MLCKQDCIKVYKHMVNNYNKDFKPDVIHYFLLMIGTGLTPKQIYDDFVDIISKGSKYYITYKDKLILASRLVSILAIPKGCVTHVIRPFRLVSAAPKLIIPIIIREVNKALPTANIKGIEEVYKSYGKVLTGDYGINDIFDEIDNKNCSLSKKFYNVNISKL